MRKSTLIAMSLVAILAVGCKTKTKAPSREQIIADSLAIVKAKLDSSIQAQNEAVNNAALAGNDEELLKAMSELYKLHNLEVENDKALEQVEARLAAAATENGKEAKLEQPKAPEAPATKPVEAAVQKDAEGNEVIPFATVSEKPTFKSKDANSFSKWVSSNLQYPQEAIDKNIEGTSIIKFLVNKDGKVSNVEVLKSANELLDKEAVRVISESPEWSAGKQNGEAVPVSYIFPVVFRLAK